MSPVASSIGWPLRVHRQDRLPNPAGSGIARSVWPGAAVPSMRTPVSSVFAVPVSRFADSEAVHSSPSFTRTYTV